MCRNHPRNSPPVPAGPRKELKTYTKTFTDQTHTHPHPHTHSKHELIQPTQHTQHTLDCTPSIMSDDGESSTPPPCELWMVLHEEKCGEWSTNTMSFSQKVYGLYTEELQSPKYTVVDSMGENGWEKWRDYLLKPPPPSSTLISPGLMTWWSQRTVRKWVREAGSGVGVGVKMADGDEDVKILNVCAVIVSVGEIIVSCTV